MMAFWWLIALGAIVAEWFVDDFGQRVIIALLISIMLLLATVVDLKHKGR